MVMRLTSIFVLAALTGFMTETASGQSANQTRLGFNSEARVLWLQTLEASVKAARVESGPVSSSLRVELPERVAGEKSRGAAFLRSLIVPGWGQRYAGSRKAAYFFFASEILLWGGHISQQRYGSWLRDDYKLFAATHAGIDPQGKPNAFFIDIGNYASLDEYNNEQLRRRSVSSLYPRQAGYDWQWDSEVSRLNYRRMRVRSDEAFNRAAFFVGGVFANHLISAIHSVWAVHRYNSRLASNQSELRFGVETRAADKGVLLRISRQF
jgi:hypothetical protein